MPRRARIAVAGIPWHIIQRDNNLTECFFMQEIKVFRDKHKHSSSTLIFLAEEEQTKRILCLTI